MLQIVFLYCLQPPALTKFAGMIRGLWHVYDVFDVMLAQTSCDDYHFGTHVFSSDLMCVLCMYLHAKCHVCSLLCSLSLP